VPEVPLSKLFVLLFMMTGPLRVVPMFAGLTRELDAASRSRIALRAVLFAASGVLLAVFIGHKILKSWGASPQALAFSTGLLLLLTALQALVGWPTLAPPGTQAESSSDGLALAPLAFPTILPPFAVGVLILFGAYFPDQQNLWKMAGLSLGLLTADWIGMRFARQIMAVIGTNTLQVLGAVFGVLQLSLAVEMIFWALRIGDAVGELPT
jgi:multiple antibiotic resistance protein